MGKGKCRQKALITSFYYVYIRRVVLPELCCSPIRSFLFPPISGEIDQWLANLKWRICSCPSIRIMKVSHELTNKGPRPLMPRILLSSPLKILLLQCSLVFFDSSSHQFRRAKKTDSSQSTHNTTYMGQREICSRHVNHRSSTEMSKKSTDRLRDPAL